MAAAVHEDDPVLLAGGALTGMQAVNRRRSTGARGRPCGGRSSASSGCSCRRADTPRRWGEALEGLGPRSWTTSSRGPGGTNCWMVGMDHLWDRTTSLRPVGAARGACAQDLQRQGCPVGGTTLVDVSHWGGREWLGLLRGVNLDRAGDSRRPTCVPLSSRRPHRRRDLSPERQRGVHAGRSGRPRAGDPDGAAGRGRPRRREAPTRTGAEMAKIVAANPYVREDPTKSGRDVPRGEGREAGPRPRRGAPSRLYAHGSEVYLEPPARARPCSPLLAAVAKVTEDDGLATSRNWRTVLALAEMSRVVPLVPGLRPARWSLRPTSCSAGCRSLCGCPGW